MWRNVDSTVQLLKTAHSQPSNGIAIDVPFPKFGCDPPQFHGLDYRLSIRPFGLMRRMLLNTVKRVTGSKAKEFLVVRGSVRWTLGGSTSYSLYEQKEPCGGHALHCKLAKDWLNHCRVAATPGEGWSTSFLALRPVHLALISDWMDETSSGRTKFSERFGWIWDSCREIIWEVNPHLSLLTKSRNALKHRAWFTVKQDADCAYAHHRDTIKKLDELTDHIERCLVNCWSWQPHQKPAEGHPEGAATTWPRQSLHFPNPS
ncbi:hypothetical protein BDV06DRAFT_30575 [Aspergillus oleicola]